MHPVLEKLAELDHLGATLDSIPPAEGKKELTSKARALRTEISADVLMHYDRLKAGGKRGVAPVVNGTCQACHLQLSSGTAARLLDKSQVHLCENCGCYIYPLHVPPSCAVSPPMRRKRAPSRRFSPVPADSPLQVA